MIKLISSLLELVFNLLAGTITALFDFIPELIQPTRKTEFNADFIPDNKILCKEGFGFCLNGKYSLSLEESTKNCLVLGGSGSGKSSTILINSALIMAKGGSSLIFHDPSHEIRLRVSGALKAEGYEIKVINYSDVRSECFNSLKRCKSISDIQKLSALLVRNALGEASDPFWSKSAESILSIFIRYLVFYAEPKYRTLYSAQHLINEFASSPEKIDRLIVRTKDEKLYLEYKTIVSYPERTLASIMATIKSVLVLFSDEIIADITSHDTLDFAEFRKKKIALFLNSAISDVHYYSTLSSLFFQQFFNEIMRELPTDDDNYLFFLLDEASSMYFPNLSTTIANIRKYKSGILLSYQDYHQLEHQYGVFEAKNISANAYAKVYLPNQPIETCKTLETILGKFEYQDEDGKRQIRSLMVAEEIRLSKKAIILIGNQKPIHADLYPYYLDKKLKALTEFPFVEPNKQLPFDTPPLIELPDEWEVKGKE